MCALDYLSEENQVRLTGRLNVEINVDSVLTQEQALQLMITDEKLTNVVIYVLGEIWLGSLRSSVC